MTTLRIKARLEARCPALYAALRGWRRACALAANVCVGSGRGAAGRRQVKRVVEQSPCSGSAVVVISNRNWRDPLFQRPQQLARAFATLGRLVFYCTPNGIDRVRSITRAEENLFLCPHIEGLSGLSEPLIYLMRPDQRPLIEGFRQPYRLIYDYLDDLLLLGPPDSLRLANHQWLLKNADVVCATADRLLADARQVRPDALSSPNAVDYGRFHVASDPPEDMCGLLDKPILGYHGAIAEWFDYDLLHYAAMRCPDVNFVLIGKDYFGRFARSPWTQMSNMHFLGPRPHSILPAYSAAYTVAMIPFLVNEVTLSTSPVKLFEYFASGKPVVTTALPECRKYGGVYVAEDAEDFVKGLRRLVAGDFDLAVIDRDARENDWQSRARAILSTLEARLAKA